jgi:hypothetical protein
MMRRYVISRLNFDISLSELDKPLSLGCTKPYSRNCWIDFAIGTGNVYGSARLCQRSQGALENTLFTELLLLHPSVLDFKATFAKNGFCIHGCYISAWMISFSFSSMH